LPQRTLLSQQQQQQLQQQHLYQQQLQQQQQQQQQQQVGMPFPFFDLPPTGAFDPRPFGAMPVPSFSPSPAHVPGLSAASPGLGTPFPAWTGGSSPPGVSPPMAGKRKGVEASGTEQDTAALRRALPGVTPPPAPLLAQPIFDASRQSAQEAPAPAPAGQRIEPWMLIHRNYPKHRRRTGKSSTTATPFGPPPPPPSPSSQR
jgi:hypothetical protein